MYLNVVISLVLLNNLILSIPVLMHLALLKSCMLFAYQTTARIFVSILKFNLHWSKFHHTFLTK